MKLDEWYDDLLGRRSATLRKKVRVEGLRDAHLGPRWEFARVVVEAEPSTSFSVECLADVPSEHGEFFRAAVFGILDILLASEPLPMRDVTLRVVELEVHPTDSSNMAFRRAGSDAGRKLLAHATFESEAG